MFEFFSSAKNLELLTPSWLKFRVLTLPITIEPGTKIHYRIRWPLSTMIRDRELALGRIVDKTGLDGRYNFTLEFAGYMGPGGAFPAPLPDGQTDTASLLMDAIRQQLGLSLVEKKAPFDALVVDRAEKVPTEN